MRPLLLSLVLSCLVFASSCVPETSAVSPATGTTSGAVKTEKIRSAAEYRRMEADLSQAALLGDARAAFLLGMLYASPAVLDDGSTIPARPKKARKYLEDALNGGIGLAALELAMLEVKSGSPANGLHAIDRAFETTQMADPDRIVLATQFAAIVLDYFPKEKRAVEKAAARLESAIHGKDVPTAAYLLANLYRVEGEMDRANRFLNRACQSDKAPDELRKMCFNSKLYDIEPIKEGK